MLADAISAERFRLMRDRSALFWGFLFVPLASLGMSLAGDLFMHAVFKRALPNAAIDIGGKAMSAVAGAGSPWVVLFLLIGAAAILGGDYRWETWRLITPRNRRSNILLAKLLVFGEATAWSLLLMAAASALGGLVGAMIHRSALASPAAGSAYLSQFAGVFVIVWLQLMVLGALVACVAVAARSTMGAVVAGLVATVVQSIAAGLQGFNPAPTLKSLAIPTYAADQLKAYVTAPAGFRPDAQPAGVGLALILAWLVVLTGAAVLLFQRQDLTRE
jgi:ABC-2 type transport system permease protein